MFVKLYVVFQKQKKAQQKFDEIISGELQKFERTFKN
jgi:hypothetical protein